jgi:two-component system, chemotaxis family, CheB/CheR fusion protein
MAMKKARRRSDPPSKRPRAASDPPMPERIDAKPAAPSLPVVGIGASAGGLEAFSQLLHALPANTGMAFVLVQHLAPQHESALPTLLSNVSPMPVVQVTDAMRVEPDHVYVIPPNAQLTLFDGELRLAPRGTDRTQYNPIDLFFRSLAESAQESAIAIVLSGTASDGSAGIREVKAAGGITIAQRPETAKYDGMPRAAIATGMVDLTLAPQEIATALVEIGRHPYVRSGVPEEESALERELPEPAHLPIADEQLQRVFAHLRSVSGVDFKQYKLPTILRRLHRRMALHKLTQLSQYLEYIQQNPAEAQELYHDILIHVTRFFREPESFEALRQTVIPEIVAQREGEQPIRIWICGCATGEEAYSVAISLVEYLGDASNSVPIQIFATDVAETAIEYARNGVYPESISVDVSPERLRRFFTKTDGNYRIAKSIRDMCVFARQDLTRDPPFSKLDLVLCRNVLIYMTAPLQRKLMAVFHYALKPTGFLMLGHAESIGPHSDLFAVADKRNRIYARKLTDTLVSFPVDYSTLPASTRGKHAAVPARDESRSIQAEANRIILDRYGPPGVVVDRELQIVQFRGQTGPYLEPAPGDPSLSLLKMAREGLIYGLRTALHAARKRNVAVRREGLRVRDNGEWREVTLEVLPLMWANNSHYLVLFRDVTPSGPASKGKKGGAAGRGKAGKKPRADGLSEDFHLAGLQQELAASREYLQSIIQEVEAANEELQSANEEILSSNEELQSTNEELDTAKEELQSTNEELNTVNEELHARNEELSRVNSDLLNLLGSVEIAIVIVANDLRIRRFTPMAERVLNLIPTDIGRPIGHIKPNIDCPQLETLITHAIDDVVLQETEVQDRQGNWYSLRIRPYKNVDNKIDGAVLSLFDVNSARLHEREIGQARHYTRAVFEVALHPMVMIDATHTVRVANQHFVDLIDTRRTEIENRDFFTLAHGTFDTPALRAAIERVSGSEELEIEPELPTTGGKKLRALVRHVDGSAAQLEAVTILSLQDVS